MNLSRRLFLAGCAGLPAFASLKAVPVLALPHSAGAPAMVGDVWGMTYFASGGVADVAARRRPSRPLRHAPLWHPEFA